MDSPFEAFVGFILNKKLDPESIRIYESTIEKPREIPQLEDFFGFLERRFQSLEAMGNHRATAPRPHMQYISPLKRVNTAMLTKTCWVEGCKEYHGLNQCQQFKKMSTLERARLVNSANLCIRCLGQHQGKNCQAETCVVCKGGHHTLLHCNNAASTTGSSVKTAKTFVISQQGQVLLPTALVRAATGTGDFFTLRALIDPGSQATLISSKAANLFNFKKEKVHVTISGVGGKKAGICRHTINLKISPRFDGDFQMNIKPLIFDKLDQQLPEVDFATTSWTYLNQIQLADPHYNQSQPIDLILGADYYPSILINNIIKGGQLEPMAQQTEFGWIILGSRNNTGSRHKTTMIATKSIEDQLRLLIENDSIPEERDNTEEEILIEKHFESNVEQGPDGRYTVRIPFKNNQAELGESRKTAAARLIQLEKRFKKDAPFKQLYHQFMQEYINLKHMEPVQEKPEDGKSTNIYYIPHHGIIKKDSTTTRLRVVFDASSKTTTGISLNDCMMNGPKLQQDLADILLRWRKHKIVMTADIEKMYRQIWINKQDQNYQRILWRSNPLKPMEAYKLKTVTYGTTAASFLAIRALKQLATDGINDYPIGASIILTDFYVDDLLTGSNNIEEATRAVQELKMLTERGGLNLRKWFSNSREVLNHIPRELHGTGDVQIKLNDCIKTLGILYDPQKDLFKFNVETLQLSHKQPTKRSLLSDSSKLFDPVGWLSPITITAKIMMQEVWTSGIDWDQPLPENINTKWVKYKKELSEIKNITIQRWVNTTDEVETELHGFADASEYAYAATIYCRTTNKEGIITTQLLTSKTRVAPTTIKLSIPRLELNATLLLAKLLKHTQRSLKINNLKIYAWSDSTIALCWITGEPNKFKTFVANRISAVKTMLPAATWHHVKSCDNPADIASRGTTPLALIKNRLWWEGPDFLRQKLTRWKAINPIIQGSTLKPEELEEKAIKIMTTTTEDHAFPLFERCSSYNKLKRVVAYCKRFINNCSRRNNNRNELTGAELQNAEIIILKLVQGQDFYKEINRLNKAEKISTKSKILSLNPTIDENGLLRLNGRLQNSILPSSSKNPIILSRHNVVTKRIIEDAHIGTLHGGTQLTLATLRNKFWIIDGKRAVKQIIQKCIICFRHKQHSSEQLMGNLPSPRVRPGRPFIKTGIDYAGPIQLRSAKGRGHKTYKAYIALFICMVTKAIHIEIISDLTTESFIAAYKRFISRRGLCTDIYSDNGTYFVGANNVMQRDHRRAMTTLPSDIATMIADNGTNWHFIPPLTPHFGGIWEAGIKSMKFHLKRIIGETTLTFEELCTVTTQIEACLNSRPLTPLTSDPADLTALTPGHFLIGDSLKALPAAEIDRISLRTRWHVVERMVQDFWKRWSSEYLHQLQQRTKWKSSQSNLMINDLVLLKDDQQPATRWKLGRIVETHAGKDELVRVATVKCENATYKRPIVKLCKLPIEEGLQTIMPMQANHGQPRELQSPEKSNQVLRRQPHRNVKNRGTVNHLALATLFICCFLGLVQANVHITPFNYSTGIYFEEIGKLEVVAMKWTLVVYYNMSNYWEEIETFKQTQYELKAACLNIAGLNCDLILQQIQWQYNNLIADNELLLASNKEVQRPKRGLGDTIGLVLGDTFGILTEREARYYEAQFEAINNDQQQLESLIKSHTTIIDNTINLVKHNSRLTMESLNNLIEQQRRLNAEMKLLNEYSIREEKIRSILTSTIELMLILKNLGDTQQALLDVVQHAHKNLLHPSLLAPAQLQQELELIKRHIPTTITIPGHGLSDLLHIYHSMRLRSRVTQGNIIIKITIPLSFALDYTLLAVFPVPNIEHNSTQSYITTNSEYLALDDHREHFSLLTREEVKRCQLFQNNRFLCEISPIYNAMTNQNQCEVAILQRIANLEGACTIKSAKISNHWIKLHATNQWIYSIPNETTFDVICGQGIKSFSLQGSGILEIKAGCVLRDTNLYIVAIGSASNNISKSFRSPLSTLNGANNLRTFITRVRNKTIEYDEPQFVNLQDTTQLEQEIQAVREKEVRLHEGNFHHIHHYTMIHTIFWIGAAICIIWGINYIKQRRTTRPPPSPLQRSEA